MGVLDGKTVLVTGGGSGIGRECALLAAREGANILVNDLGASLSGADNSDAGSAEIVANEIIENGGKADWNNQSVTDLNAVEQMVEQAKDTYGGLDIVMNPAGILRDGMFHKMSETDWRTVIDVHLHGTFNVTRAAVNLFREQEDGAFILFTSTSGLIGSIGQANYSAAKMGIAGLSRIIALEGQRKNVRSNVIAPFGWTRMTASVPVKGEEGLRRAKVRQEKMRADQVAHLAVALAAPDASRMNGQIFCVRGNEVSIFSQPRPVKAMTKLEGWTPAGLISEAFPAMTRQANDLDTTAEIFPYDPV